MLKHHREDEMVKLGSVLFIALTFLSFSPAAGAEKLPAAGSGQNFRDCPECPEMVVIPAGSFIMGSPKSDISFMESELPQHKVTFSMPFAAGKFAVKFEEWDACLAGGGCGGYKPDDEGLGRGNWPAINVSWKDAKAYIEWLSKKAGKPYRLLSEADWEYAARAGSASENFAYELWEDQTYDDPASGRKSPAQPNAWGLRNIYGRPVQWVEDCWNDNYRGRPETGRVGPRGIVQSTFCAAGQGRGTFAPHSGAALPPKPGTDFMAFGWQGRSRIEFLNADLLPHAGIAAPAVQIRRVIRICPLVTCDLCKAHRNEVTTCLSKKRNLGHTLSPPRTAAGAMVCFAIARSTH
jgi:formylglycine-generating enzyme required for sulfatase activity